MHTFFDFKFTRIFEIFHTPERAYPRLHRPIRYDNCPPVIRRFYGIFLTFSRDTLNVSEQGAKQSVLVLLKTKSVKTPVQYFTTRSTRVFHTGAELSSHSNKGESRAEVDGYYAVNVGSRTNPNNGRRVGVRRDQFLLFVGYMRRKFENKLRPERSFDSRPRPSAKTACRRNTRLETTKRTVTSFVLIPV